VNAHDSLEHAISRWLAAEAEGSAPEDRFEEAMDATRRQRPRPALVAGVGSAWGDAGWAGAHVVSLRVVVVVALLVTLATSVILAAGQQPPMPAVRSFSEVYAFAYDGDIFVGDPATGASAALVTGPESDSRPVLSPDGAEIAFLRGNVWTPEASILVMSADGSNLRVATPQGFSDAWISFAWTPDSASLVVVYDKKPLARHQADVEFAIVQVAELAEPRVVTKEFPSRGRLGLGAAKVAGMYRPPKAGQVVLAAASWSRDIYLWDAAFEQHSTLRPVVPGAVEPYYVGPLGWTPDGSQIIFAVGSSSPQDPGREQPADGVYVMDDTGGNVRRLPIYGEVYSPDGSMVASDATPAECHDGVMVVADLVSGAERVLEATRVATKVEGSPVPGAGTNCPRYEWSGGRAWAYEGWSWTPDSRGIVFVEKAGTRPVVVDVETGRTMELPWVVDSAPSWVVAAGVDPSR
jgi:dipeptidyl aminopeptidase/acylaminoacyl peptidase